MGLLIVLAVGSALVAWKVWAQVRLGGGWDTYSFLANAAHFAGKSIGYDEPVRPPLLSLLTSVVFRVSPLAVWPIQVVDGVMSASGVVALYLLLRRRVEQTAATISSLAVLAFQPVWTWVGVGYSDVAAMSLTVWAIYFTVRATEDDPRWYIAAFPMLVLASLTRVTALLAIFALLLLFAMRGRPFAHARYIALGVLSAVVVYLPAALYYSGRFGDALFPYLANLNLANELASRGAVGFGTEPGGWALMPGILVASLTWLALSGAVGTASRTSEGRRAGTRWRVPLLVAAVGVIAVSQASGGIMARQASIPIGIYLAFRALARREDTGPLEGRPTASAALDAAMIVLMLAYVDFHGHHPVRVWRYLVTVAPTYVFLLAVGWSTIAESVGRTLEAIRPGNERAGREIAWGALVVALSVLLAFEVSETVRQSPDPVVVGAAAASEWIDDRTPSAENPVIYSDLWPITSWYVGRETRAMPRFPDPRAYAHELQKRDAAYYMTLGTDTYAPTFAPLYRSDPVTVLGKVVPNDARNPSIRYLGKAWENYLEVIDDFKVDLYYDGGLEGWVGSVFMDAYSADELRRYNAVAVYRVRWYDRGRAESTISDYVESGGSLIIDASGNLDGAAYPLLDTILFDTVIRRQQVPENATLSPAGAFAERHPELASAAPGRWVDEAGGPWFGASYTPVPGTPPGEVLLRLDGSPAATLQRVGKGRVYWISSNLMWHAFKLGSASERSMVAAVIDEAVSQPPIAAEGDLTRVER